MREVPVTYIVSSEEPTRPDTSGDERLARSLQQEETMRAEKRSSRAAAAPGRPPRPPPPTAPPLPQEAGWAADWWRQQPCGGVDVDLVGQEESGDEGSDGLGDGRQRRPRYDEQQAAAAAEQQRQQQRQRAAQEEEDEALAQRLYEQELRQLSGEDRERLSRLPGMLADSRLVRNLSAKLQELAGGFTKLSPQVNRGIAAVEEGEEEAPDAARKRLEERLQLYCLVERRVPGDGSCQFASLSDQLYRTPRLHAFVRECVCQQLRAHPDRYSCYVVGDESYEAYCRKMARPTTWGDHVTLQAAADFFGVRICVLSSFKDNYLLEIEPQQTRSSRVLWLSFWAEVHYNSVVPEDSPEAQQQQQQKPPQGVETLLGSAQLHSLLFGRGLAGTGAGRAGNGGGVRIIPVE